MKTSTILHGGRFFLSFILLWSWHATMPAARAQPHPEQRLDLDSLVREATANNPEIRAAQQRWEAAKAVIPQAKTLPDPLVTFGYENVVDREWTYGVSQELPFPGKLRLRGEVATREAERLEQAYRAGPLKIIARLKEAFYDLALVHTSMEIVEKSRLVLRDFEQTAQTRYAVGRGVQQDVFRAQTEVSRLLVRLATLEQRKESLHADINRLLNRPPSDPLGRPQPIQVTPLRRSLVELHALVEAAPLLQAQVKDVERGDQTIALARREYLPDFEVSASGVRNETMRKDGYQLMLGVRVPLYYATKQRAGVREALAGREVAVQDLRAVRQDLLFRLKDNFVQAQRAEQLIAILKDAILPQAQLTLESAQAGYAVGKVDFLTLLSSLLTLQENELELHGEVVEHEKALARLEEIIGSAP
jgi:outer membrane protein TolC